MSSQHLSATLIEGPVGQRLFYLALPMTWGLLGNMSFNLVDTLFVAQLGTTSLAAISFALPVVMVCSGFAMGLGAGISSTVARAIGAGEKHRVQRLVTDAMTLAVLISIALAAIGIATIEPLFLLLGAEPALLPPIKDYMQIWYGGVFTLVLPLAAIYIMRAMGNSRLASRLMLWAALLNLVLDPLLIFGLLGFPRLELQGAALGTVIARTAALALGVHYFIRGIPLLTNPCAPPHLVAASWRQIGAVGIPATATNILLPLAAAMVTYLIAGHGTDAVAGFGIVMRIEPFALIGFFALASVTGPFFGQNLGAGKYQRLHRALRVALLFCAASGLVLAVALWFFGQRLAALFSDAPAVLAVCALYFALVPVSYGAYGMMMTANAAFNGLGRAMAPVVLSTVRVVLLYLPLAWFGNAYWGLTGIFAAAVIVNLIVGVWSYRWLHATLSGLRQPRPPGGAS